jgi:hypothetical protein
MYSKTAGVVLRICKTINTTRGSTAQQIAQAMAFDTLISD